VHILFQIRSDFLIEIADLDEFPETYIFIPNTDSQIPNKTIDDLIHKKPADSTYFLPQKAYDQKTLGQIVFIIEDHERDLTLAGLTPPATSELGFEKPVCDLLSQKPYRSLCRSTVFVANPNPAASTAGNNGYAVTTPLNLTSNDQSSIFSIPLRLKFENIVGEHRRLPHTGQRSIDSFRR
jgi:hypothetical protein